MPPAPKLIDVAEDLRMYGTSAIDVRFLYKEIFECGSYRNVVLPEHPFIVDAGANVGVFTLFMKRLHPDAEILAFEPVPEVAEAARLNVEHFDLDRVTVHTVALGEADVAARTLRHYPLRPSGSSVSLTDQTGLKVRSADWAPTRLNERMYRGREIDVEVARLSAFLRDDQRIDLLKIDVVGAELDVFAGLDETHWPLVDYIIVDAQNVDGRLDEVRMVLETHGFTFELTQNSAAAGDGLNFLIHGRRC
jgi:FkbM family methyltransferase